LDREHFLLTDAPDRRVVAGEFYYGSGLTWRIVAPANSVPCFRARGPASITARCVQGR